MSAWRASVRAMSDAPGSRQKVRVLPPALADQIAAGEVVERPASVVKELVENALDAGARRIDVEIEGGGRRLVRVVDDGSGMDPDDARLALRRHATSKIASADDLWGLRTFGFRGEALPSIAAVSRLTLATRPPDAAAGFKLTVEAGVETDAREAGIPVGTQVEVRDLFFNTPARAKFGKSEATETANVSEALLRLALANPAAHLRLRVSGRVAMDLPPHRDAAERVRAALARRGRGRAARGGRRGRGLPRARLPGRSRRIDQHHPQHVPLRRRPLRPRPQPAARARARVRALAGEGPLPDGGAVPRRARPRRRRQRSSAEAGGALRPRAGGLRGRAPRRRRRHRARAVVADRGRPSDADVHAAAARGARRGRRRPARPDGRGRAGAAARGAERAAAARARPG